MRVTKLKSQSLVLINPARYKIKWDKKRARGKNGQFGNFQQEVKDFLKPYWFAHVVMEEMRIPGSLLTCDIVNATRKIIIEASGQQHLGFNKFFHNNRKANYLGQFHRDLAKQDWAARNGFKFLEIYETDLPLKKEFFLSHGIEL